MDSIFLVIIVLILFICLISIIYIITYNKFQDVIIRINEVESTIDSSLRNKYDLLNRSISIIKGNAEIDESAFGEIVKLRSRKLSNYDLYRVLVSSYNEFLTIINDNKKLMESEEIKKIMTNITEIDEDLDNLVEYYNKNITNYNRLVKTFPKNIVATFCKYKEKLFFDKKDMSDDDEKDFKL